MSASEVQHVEGGGVGYCSSSAAAAVIIDSYHLTANTAPAAAKWPATLATALASIWQLHNVINDNMLLHLRFGHPGAQQHQIHLLDGATAAWTRG